MTGDIHWLDSLRNNNPMASADAQPVWPRPADLAQDTRRLPRFAEWYFGIYGESYEKAAPVVVGNAIDDYVEAVIASRWPVVYGGAPVEHVSREEAERRFALKTLAVAAAPNWRGWLVVIAALIAVPAIAYLLSL